MKTRASVCARKARFASDADAAVVACDARVPLRAYRCDRCGHFHLTSRTKGKRPPPRVMLGGSGTDGLEMATVTAVAI